MYNFEALNEKDRVEMLSSIGVNSIDEIFSIIPDKAKMDSLNLSDGCCEIEAQQALKKLSNNNNINYSYFIGNCARYRYIPSLINDIA
ncbi:hypothetical protein IJ425_00290, partial [bacterium]|nr:hypothetical protein [bacterium]